MSPERAALIADEHWEAWGSNDHSLREMIARAILTACAEERKAVLTEAAKNCQFVQAQKEILALRDKEDA